jgi:DNA-binding NtrC family response regulator
MRVAVRVVSATNKDLERRVAAGDFREDLYYRLAVITVRIPALNQRREDVVPIATHFLVTFGEKYGKRFTSFTPDAREFLMAYDWKGNIREMRNLIERGVLIGEGPLFSADLIAGPRLSAYRDTAPSTKSGDSVAAAALFGPIPDEGIDLEALERHYIREAVKKSGDNDAEAARLLKMRYYSFRYRKKKLDPT